MKFKVEFWGQEKYLPNRRCRKLRSRTIKGTTFVIVREVKMTEFPLVFQHPVSTWKDGAFVKERIQYRAFNGELYVRMMGPGKTGYTVPQLMQKLRHCLPWYCQDEASAQKSAQEQADEFLVVHSGAHTEVWMQMGEPMYEIGTFGLGHNHGGTVIFIANHYNDNLPKERYFTALEGNEAVEKAVEIARARGDTNSVELLRETDRIQVFMPELVRRNPSVEGGNGDEFCRDVEKIVQATDSALEAGLLVLKRTVESMSE